MSDVSDENVPVDDEDTMDEDSDFGYDNELEESGFMSGDDDNNFGYDSYEPPLSQDPSKAERKLYEVEYSCHSIQSIMAEQQKEIDHVASMFLLKDTDAAILLRHFGWNKERLIERYMDQPEEINLEAGITDDTARPKVQSPKNFECDICCSSTEDTGKPMETLALSCGHRYCKDCYQEYVDSKIKEGESRRVQCMNDECKLIVDEKTVELLVEPAMFDKYKTLLNRAYVEDSGIMRWCPGVDCEMAVECHVPAKKLDKIVPSVVCACGEAFCFGCGLAAHQPVTCSVCKVWLKKCEDDSETANWINANTKECPKCATTIEKNGGCNHMTCRKCRYEWCWICIGPWSEHGSAWYNCNRYDEKSGTDARDAQAKSRASLERYLHYFNRFANHEQSARLDRDLYSRTEKKMEEMQRTSALTWIEVQFYKKAVDILAQCRMTLKWTYAMAYYLARNNMTEIFEDNQRDLERAVEELSGELEKPIEPETIPALRQKVTDLAAYVQRRREIVLTDTAQGFQEGRWIWTNM